MPAHIPQSDRSLDVETPAFVLERRGRHKPLRSYFEDAVLDREGSVDRETGSSFQGASHTQEGPKRGREVNTTASSSVIETPTNPTVKPILHDDDSVTGKSKFSHEFANDTLTSPSQSPKQKLTSRRLYSP